jgi:hypothetical protein
MWLTPVCTSDPNYEKGIYRRIIVQADLGKETQEPI